MIKQKIVGAICIMLCIIAFMLREINGEAVGAFLLIMLPLSLSLIFSKEKIWG